MPYKEAILSGIGAAIFSAALTYWFAVGEKLDQANLINSLAVSKEK